MRCPACNHENRDTARFCESCAGPLKRACASCGSELRPTAKFCDACAAPVIAAAPAHAQPAERSPRAYTPKHLAEKILQSKFALEGERKQVTVLFADVKGSMELAEQFDPEQWHRLLERFFEILAECVHRFEGTVNQYTGDGIMALFGAPIAHEDHAQRACYAAVALRDALRDFAREVKRQHGLDFATRIGLNSGEVVVGRIGDDLRMDYTAQGHTVGLAQRMEALASAGSIYVSDRTAAIVTGYFTLDDLGEFTLKGKSEPTHVFELQGIGALRTRFDRSRARGLSKFVGRAKEMGALEAALERALAGNGQVVGVVADAGTGKSRLCFEFAEACRARGIQVRSTTGVSHGKAVPLLPVLEFYRGVFGITERDDARAARQKIAGSVVQNDEALVASLPLLFDFLGVPDPAKPVTLEPGPDRQRALLAVLKRMTLARSRREPAVILFEDLHWVDEATEVFLENLVDAADASRTLLLVNFRPEYRADWMRRSYYQQLALAPLDPRAFAEMLGEALGADPSLADLAGRIHARSGGNPFFAEEIMLSLIESGALVGTPGAYRLARATASLEIPATVQLVLAARIDRLGEREKNVLQSASVIGREFSESLLRRVADLEQGALALALRTLVQAEFLHETALYPEAEYAFKHPLTQEVALGSQLRERRERVHAAVARALIEVHSGALDEHAALLAHHFEAAGDKALAVGFRERAAAWLEPRDPHAARREWERLLELVGAEPLSLEHERAALLACSRIINLGFTLGIDFAPGEALYQRGRALAARVDDPNLEAGLLAGYMRIVGFSGEGSSGTAAALREEAFRLAPRVTSPYDFAELIAAEAGRILSHGVIAEGLLAVDEALASSRVTASTPVPFARLIQMRARVLTELGRLDEASAEFDRAAALVADSGDVRALHSVELMRGVEFRQRGFPEGSLERIARYVASADGLEAHFSRVQSRFNLAEAFLFAGNPRAALETIDAGVAIANESRASLSLVFGFDTQRARALLALGQLDAARDLAERLVAKPTTSVLRARSLLALVEVLIASNAASLRERIEASLVEVTEIAEFRGAIHLHAEAGVERAHLARATGDAAGWQRELREALRIYTEMNATGWIERIHAELAS